MTLIEIPQEDKRCFVTCLEDKRKQGYCSCYNKIINKQLRQYNVVRQSEQLVCSCGYKKIKTNSGYECGNAKCSL